MKQLPVFLLFMCVTFSCSEDSVSNRAEFSVETIAVTDSIIYLWFEGIYSLQNVHIGVEGLEGYLQDKGYTNSDFEKYLALSAGYQYLGQLKSADSVLNVINRENITGRENYFWLSRAFNIAIQKNEYKRALGLLEEQHNYYFEDSDPVFNSYGYLLTKWDIYSRIKNCDSIKLYYSELTKHLFENSLLRVELSISDKDLDFLMSHSTASCPHIDSAGKALPGIIIRE